MNKMNKKIDNLISEVGSRLSVIYGDSIATDLMGLDTFETEKCFGIVNLIKCNFTIIDDNELKIGVDNETIILSDPLKSILLKYLDWNLRDGIYHYVDNDEDVKKSDSYLKSENTIHITPFSKMVTCNCGKCLKR